MDVGAHEMLRFTDRLVHVHIDPLELSGGALQVGEEEDACGGVRSGNQR